MPDRCDEHPGGCPVATAGRAFYVTVRSGSRVGWLAGPYPTHPAALVALRPVRAMAEQADRWSFAYFFGTAQGPATIPTVFGVPAVPAEGSSDHGHH